MNRTTHGAGVDGDGSGGSEAWLLAVALVAIVAAVVTVVVVVLRHPMVLGVVVAIWGTAAGWW